ncbi:right-handed parallel beta-helix repeat-containing protein [Rhodovulum marinum]|uniref:Uncharacterized protein n=1 Tax=Rhodovulum marinum TaxID=320662 RepID=A0A4R2PU29_9RHOB|nr:right-handed parallel beta-helix repeat-containing protein [Rhodovulum marinum]TCP39532.1 hypothetical protein EV662_11112 [Rhodovulum marinum]
MQNALSNIRADRTRTETDTTLSTPPPRSDWDIVILDPGETEPPATGTAGRDSETATRRDPNPGRAPETDDDRAEDETPDPADPGDSGETGDGEENGGPGDETDTETGEEDPQPPDETDGQDDAGQPSDPAGPVVTLSPGTTLSLAGGRVTTLLPEQADEIAAVEITDLPEHGNATVNPDNTIALVLSGSDYSGPLSLDYTITYTDGTVDARTASFDVAAPTQEAGWGTGTHYMLAEDANGDIVVEHGDNHRKVYVSGSETALSKADIAAREGLSEGEITAKWLVAHPEYGGSEAMALAVDAGMELWIGKGGLTGLTLNNTSPAPSSHWLMFEKGYTYEDLGGVFAWGARGESELHPLHVTSWGTGDRPVIDSAFGIAPQWATSNIVVSDLELVQGFGNLTADNVILTNMHFSGGVSFQGFSRPLKGFTLHNSEIVDVVPPEPEGGTWSGTAAGLFVRETSGILIEDTLFHHNGWGDDYRLDGSTEGGMPPNKFSHNIYLQNTTTDVTFRDNISAQAASVGAQFRGGGHIENNAFIDNNVAFNVLGGVYRNDGPIGNYSFVADNVVTSAGYKLSSNIGAVNWGIQNTGYDTTVFNNIIAHLADPNNPAEIAWKTGTSNPLTTTTDLFHDDTIIYNWLGTDPNSTRTHGNERYDSDLDTDIADQTTIQNFAAQFLGRPAGAHPDDEQLDNYYKSGWLTELMAYARENWTDGAPTAQDIVAYFQNSFGVAPNGTETTHRFVPNTLADGIRWDTRINWTTQAVPDDGDNVDLGGNWVYYGARTTTITDLDLGSGGRLHVTSGKLTVEGALETGADGGLITVEGPGQFWFDGYGDADLMIFDVTGGRLANTGEVTGTTAVAISGGQAILATDGARYDLTGGSELRIEGADASVGFDGNGTGTALLRMHDGSVLTFDADAEGFATLTEFRSGRWDQQGSPVDSHVILDGTLKLDLSDLPGGADSLSLIEVDMLSGTFDAIDIHGLGGDRNATIILDHAADELRLELSAGSGQTAFLEIGIDLADPALHVLSGDLPDLFDLG